MSWQCVRYMNPITGAYEGGCGEINQVIFDGGEVAERDFDTIMFIATAHKDGSITVDAVGGWDNNPYLHKYSKNYWIPKLIDHIKNYDISTCAKCNAEIEL